MGAASPPNSSCPRYRGYKPKGTSYTHVPSRQEPDRRCRAAPAVEGSPGPVTPGMAVSTASGCSCAGSGQRWSSCSSCWRSSPQAGCLSGGGMSSRGSAAQVLGRGGLWRACRSRGCSSCWGWPGAWRWWKPRLKVERGRKENKASLLGREASPPENRDRVLCHKTEDHRDQAFLPSTSVLWAHAQPGPNASPCSAQPWNVPCPFSHPKLTYRMLPSAWPLVHSLLTSQVSTASHSRASKHTEVEAARPSLHASPASHKYFNSPRNCCFLISKWRWPESPNLTGTCKGGRVASGHLILQVANARQS